MKCLYSATPANNTDYCRNKNEIPIAIYSGAG